MLLLVSLIYSCTYQAMGQWKMTMWSSKSTAPSQLQLISPSLISYR